jgi:hypothetical protein
MVSNRLSHCRLEMAEEVPRGATEKRKVKMEKERRVAAEDGKVKMEDGERAAARRNGSVGLRGTSIPSPATVPNVTIRISLGRLFSASYGVF